MPPYEVQAACYGRGAIYPVVVLDAVHRWARPTHPGLPERQPGECHGMLVLRWTGSQGEHAVAPGLLAAAAARAPAMPATGGALRAYQESLPHGLYLTTLSAELVLGPWARRPGLASARPCRHGSGPS